MAPLKQGFFLMNCGQEGLTAAASPPTHTRNPIFQMLCDGSRPVKRVKKDEVHAAALKECFSLKAVVRSGIKMSHPQLGSN